MYNIHVHQGKVGIVQPYPKTINIVHIFLLEKKILLKKDTY